jgi:hypothetical protein
MTDRVQELASVLRDQATSVLAPYPALNHKWLDQGAIVTLIFPPSDDSGFEVAVQVGNGYLYVLVDHSHYSFDVRSQPPESEITRALTLVCELLSTNMRLREIRSNDKPYRWLVERNVNGHWEPEIEEQDVLFNYFGRRAEHVYYNRQIPAP